MKKQLTGRLHMSRSLGSNRQGVSIELTDKTSGVVVAVMDLNTLQFGELIAGFQTDCDYTTYAVTDERLGLQEEVRRAYVVVPQEWRKWIGDDWKEAWTALTSKLEVDGWKADFEPKFIQRELTEDGYPVVLRRYVQSEVVNG